MQRLMSAYSPDIVVLAFYVNDIVSKHASMMNAQGEDTDSVRRKLVYLLKRSALLLSLMAAYDTVRESISPRGGFQLQNALLAGESNPKIDRHNLYPGPAIEESVNRDMGTVALCLYPVAGGEGAYPPSPV
jgi:hypothetical protein